MLDILLWVLFLTVVEGGAVSLTVWLERKIDDADLTCANYLLIVALAFALIIAVAAGVMLLASAVLGTIRLFGMYG